MVGGSALFQVAMKIARNIFQGNRWHKATVMVPLCLSIAEAGSQRTRTEGERAKSQDPGSKQIPITNSQKSRGGPGLDFEN